MTHPTRQAIVRWAVAVLLALVVVYPLSYAPMVRWKASQRPKTPFLTLYVPIDGTTFPAYQPVDWLIDNTSLRRPLFAWAQICHVEDEFEYAADFRRSIDELITRFEEMGHARR